jgi:dipeptidyl aminopeptidase/acylaminoacyl peptidase
MQVGAVETESATRAVALCTQEAFFWQAPDGLALDRLLIRPNLGPGPWPTFVHVHGGPYARSTPGLALTWARWGQWLAEMGIAVLLPHYRGGTGHGSVFARWARGGVGLHDFQDVTSMVDAAIARGIARPDRVGIGGWSQGGFMTAWAVTQTNRFRCGIMGAGVSDWGMLLTNDLPVFEQALGGDAPRDGLEAQRHRRTSPITYARNARTPLLILHGEDDERVPVNQAVAFHRALRANGTPATFVRYPREPHAIGERAHQVDLLNRVRAWCTDHLLNG